MNWYKRAKYKIAFPAVINFSSQDIEKIRELVMQGKSFKEIGNLFGVSRTPIQKLNEKYKWREKKESIPKKEFSDEEISIVKELIEEGHPFKNIADLLGVSRSVIQRINNKYKWREKREYKDLSSYENQIIDLYNSEKNPYFISQEMEGKITPSQIYRILRKKGILPPEILNSKEVREKRKKEKEERDKQIVHMYLSPPQGLGMSMNQIADHFNTGHSTIKKSLIRSGLGDEIRGRVESAELSGGREEGRKKMKRWWQDPKNKRKHIEKLRKKWQDPVYQQKMRDKALKWWRENPEMKELYSEFIKELSKERWQDPEMREKILERRYTPELLERSRRQMTERWQDPKMRQKMIDRRWTEKGGFWGWLKTLPINKRIEVINGMMFTQKDRGTLRVDDGNDFGLHQNLINKAISLGPIDNVL